MNKWTLVFAGLMLSILAQAFIIKPGPVFKVAEMEENGIITTVYVRERYIDIRMHCAVYTTIKTAKRTGQILASDVQEICQRM